MLPGASQRSAIDVSQREYGELSLALLFPVFMFVHSLYAF